MPNKFAFRSIILWREAATAFGRNLGARHVRDAPSVNHRIDADHHLRRNQKQILTKYMYLQGRCVIERSKKETLDAIYYYCYYIHWYVHNAPGGGAWRNHLRFIAQIIHKHTLDQTQCTNKYIPSLVCYSCLCFRCKRI